MVIYAISHISGSVCMQKPLCLFISHLLSDLSNQFLFQNSMLFVSIRGSPPGGPSVLSASKMQMLGWPPIFLRRNPPLCFLPMHRLQSRLGRLPSAHRFPHPRLYKYSHLPMRNQFPELTPILVIPSSLTLTLVGPIPAPRLSA